MMLAMRTGARGSRHGKTCPSLDNDPGVGGFDASREAHHPPGLGARHPAPWRYRPARWSGPRRRVPSESADVETSPEESAAATELAEILEGIASERETLIETEMEQKQKETGFESQEDLELSPPSRRSSRRRLGKSTPRRRSDGVSHGHVGRSVRGRG